MHHNVSYLYLDDDALTGNGRRIHVSICLWLQREFALFEMAAIILQNIITQFARVNITAHAICERVVLKQRQPPNLVAVEVNQVLFRVSVHFAPERWLLQHEGGIENMHNGE